MKQSGASVALMSVAMAVAALSLSACSQPPSGAPTAAASSAALPADRGATAGGSAHEGVASTGTASVTGGSIGSREGANPAQRCSVVTGWNTAPDDGGLALSSAELTDVRVGRHACYDRVVFDVDGSDPVGFTASYVPVVRADGSGEEVHVAGTAALEVVVRAPYLGSNDPEAWPHMPLVGDDLVAASSLSSWSALRDVTFAGSFEGQSTLAVGIRDKRAFRVWTLESADGQRIILDIAH